MDCVDCCYKVRRECSRIEQKSLHTYRKLSQAPMVLAPIFPHTSHPYSVQPRRTVDRFADRARSQVGKVRRVLLGLMGA